MSHMVFQGAWVEVARWKKQNNHACHVTKSRSAHGAILLLLVTLIILFFRNTPPCGPGLRRAGIFRRVESVSVKTHLMRNCARIFLAATRSGDCHQLRVR